MQNNSKMRAERKLKQNIWTALILLCAIISAGILLSITGFIVKTGYKKLSWDFIISDYNDKTVYLNLTNDDELYSLPSDLVKEHDSSNSFVFLDKWGVALEKNENDEYYEIVYIAENSPFNKTVDMKNENYPTENGDVLRKVGSTEIDELSRKQVENLFNETNSENTFRIKINRAGGGIYPMIVSTVMLILLTLIFTIPVGVCAAIYLVEYAKKGPAVRVIRFATESLAGIPSIVYGLFGMIFFVKFLNIGQSILAGSLTLAIILLPTVIRTTEETLLTVPPSYKEGSYALGANRLQTLNKIILPNTISGIIIAIILSIGRIVGESAALLFTVGTFAHAPENIFDSGASLTVRAYMEVAEYANIESACAMGIILLIIVFILNISTKLVAWRLKA